MDPIETWHDAPTFEAMEKRINVLEYTLRQVRNFLINGSWIYTISPDELIRKTLERK
jgi:hypothetical protein